MPGVILSLELLPGMGARRRPPPIPRSPLLLSGGSPVLASARFFLRATLTRTILSLAITAAILVAAGDARALAPQFNAEFLDFSAPGAPYAIATGDLNGD